MPAWLAAAAPAIASGVSSAFGQVSANATNVKLQREANQFSAAEAERTRQFQLRMSNSAVQRRMADLRSAGINPMLAAGMDASTPSGATASAQAARVENPVAGGISSAMEAIALKKNMRLMDAQIRKAKNEATISETPAMMARAKWLYYFRSNGQAREQLDQLLGAEHDATVSNSARAKWDAQLAKFSVPERRAIAQIFETTGSGAKGLQLLLPYLQMMKSR